MKVSTCSQRPVLVPCGLDNFTYQIDPYVGGRPFWAAQLPASVCPLHDCCRNEKQKQHCGLCEKFPCEVFLALRDPAMSDAEFEKSLQARQAAPRRRTEIGTGRWLREISGGQRQE